jgi:DNA polymerase-1
VTANSPSGPAQQDLFAARPATPAPSPAEPPAVELPPAPRRLSLIDASGFIFRAYHALPPLTTSRGVPSHAVLGFTRMLLKLLRERDPGYVALCFDKDSRRGRLAIDPGYKANREAPPADLLSQFALIDRVAHALCLPSVDAPGWEADDVIATLTGRALARGFEVEVITSDKDFLQLLQPGVSIFDPMKDRPITEADALERYGVRPAQMRDYQALVGDAIDNVPKVPGIGPKTAADLLGRFAGVEDLLANLARVEKPKLREALSTHAEQLRRALQLVSFRGDLPLDVDLDDLRRAPIREAEARALFTELEFFRLIGEMPSAAPTPLRQEASRVEDLAGLGPLLEALAASTRVSLVPAFEGEAHEGRLLGLGVQVASGGSWLLEGAALAGDALGRLQDALRRPGLTLEAHDLKAVLHLVFRGTEGPAAPGTDVELLSYLLNPSRKEHSLSDLARERLRAELPTLEAGQGPALTAAADAVDRLSGELWREVAAVGLEPLARELELPLVAVLARMERVGIRIELPVLAEVSAQVDGSIGALLAEVHRLAGREFNVGSPPQLAQVLYTDLALPVLKRGKTGPSTDHEVLEKLAEEHPLPRAIIEYRNVAKLKSTYLDTLPGLVGADGRIRTTFNQALAATGRLSSANPNLQNIPVRTELGRQIRRAFVAGPGNVLVSADYSQVELRILAHVSRDEGLIAAFAESADVHARTAAEVFGVPLASVTADQRRAAKMVNYGIAYGLSAHGLASRLNIPQEEAASIIARYFQRFQGIDRSMRETVEQARRSGFVESLFGRRRALPDLASRNRAVAQAAERAAINMPIQATAADLIKRAMLELDRRLATGGFQGRMILQVHDELLFEAPEAEAPRLADLAREVMAGAGALVVPLVVDVGMGHSWAEAH